MKGFDFVLKKFENNHNALSLDVLDVKKGQLLIGQGQALGHLYWIASGLLREFHRDGEANLLHHSYQMIITT